MGNDRLLTSASPYTLWVTKRSLRGPPSAQGRHRWQ